MKEKVQNIYESGVVLSEKFIRLSSLLRFMERRQAMEQGLTPLQNMIILFCYEEEQKGNFLTPQILSNLLMITPATLSVALKTLEKKKLLHRYRNKEDKRSRLLQLSDWGREKAVICKVYLNPLIGILQPLPEVQKTQLLNLLDGIVERLEHALK
jgi:DNA-binding MarR family transcriptional regulator